MVLKVWIFLTKIPLYVVRYRRKAAEYYIVGGNQAKPYC